MQLTSLDWLTVAGSLVTDMIQFGVAMTGSIAAASFALQQPQVGGRSGLMSKMAPGTIRLLPGFTDRGAPR